MIVQSSMPPRVGNRVPASSGARPMGPPWGPHGTIASALLQGMRRYATPWRNASHSFCQTGRLTRWPGCDQPRRSNRDRMAA